MTLNYQLYIDGAFADARDGRVFASINPFNRQAIATCARAGLADAQRAVQAARHAFDEGPWGRMSPSERAGFIRMIAAKIQGNRTRLAELEVGDSGSTIRKAREDVYLSARALATFADLAQSIADETLDSVSRPGRSRNLLIREPVGVVAAMIPWNFPLKMATWKLGPALAAGNTLVLKPSEETPVTAMELARLIHETGLPRGVVNIITGYGYEAGVGLTSHPMVDKVAFTGSTEVGKAVMCTSAGTMKNITLECGGKSASIVLDDADMDLAADGTLYGIFYHQGQCCEAASRVLVPEPLADEFVARLTYKTARLRLGDPMQLSTDLGPLISKKQQQRVLTYIAKGMADGARCVAGGRIPPTEECKDGYFVAPTIFDYVDNGSTIAQEEIFGPVLSVIRYRSVEEAIRLANDSPYGLAAGVWSSDPEKAMAVARRLRVGTVWINEWHLLNEHAPFGGYKQSGLGREFGLAGLHEYTELKHVHVDEVGARAKKTWYNTVIPEN